MFRIQVNTDAVEAALNDIYYKQVPYAVSRALNDTALGAQEMEREGMQRDFLIRRPWVLQQVKIKPFSTKKNLRTTVRIGENADFLDKFEEGGIKTPRAGLNIAVPITARAGKGAIVPKELRPRALHLRPVGRATRGDLRTFLVRLKSGREGIFQRTGPRPDDIRLLYWLTPSVPIPAALHFVTTVKTAAEELWPLNFEERFAEAVRTAKP